MASTAALRDKLMGLPEYTTQSHPGGQHASQRRTSSAMGTSSEFNYAYAKAEALIASKEAAAPTAKPPAEKETVGDFKRTLTFWKLCGLTFASVAGGPYGFEEAVGAGGPYLTIVGLLLVPFVWSVPNALMTAELACMMPENGGHILWVDRAFGPFWSFVNSYATLFSLIFEGGLYPVMFMDYVGQLMGVCVPGLVTFPHSTRIRPYVL
jgi:hypothetical protein